jgi:YVTN family beta-propeller protein
VTNRIYVANDTSDNVTVIDGATNATATVPTGDHPLSVAVNPVTNKIYVACQNSDNVTVIDGATNDTAIVPAGSHPAAVAVDPVSNKIYVACQNSATVTVIDGATNASTTVRARNLPIAVAVNPVTNKVYVANQGSDNVTVIDEAPRWDTHVAAVIDPVPGNTTLSSSPALTGKAVNRLRTGHTAIATVQRSLRGTQGSWQALTITSGSGADSASWRWEWGADTLLPGENLLCVWSAEAEVATTNNLGAGSCMTGNITVYPIYRLGEGPVGTLPPPRGRAANQFVVSNLAGSTRGAPTVRYALPNACAVTMELFTMQGRRVSLLVDDVRLPGYYTVPLSTIGIARGSYLLSFRGGEFAMKRRVAW